MEDSYCDKDEDVSIEAYEPKLCKMLDSFERMNSKLNDAITKFPEKESFKIFNENLKKKLKALIFLNFQGNGEEDNDNDGSQLEVDYLLDGNEAENEGIKNDRDNNQKECETKVKEKNGEINENKNHEEKNDDETEETNNHGETSQQNETNQNLLDKTRGTHKMYINKEKKLRKEKEMIQAREIMNMEIKEEQKLRRQKEKMEVEMNIQMFRKEMQMIEARESLKMKIKKEEKLTRQNEMKRTKYGQVTERAIMENLYANTKIFAEVLDTWGDLLNDQELGSDVGNSPYRLFLKVEVPNAYVSSTLCDERKYEKFKENFHDNTDGYKKT
ncbi:uncharacterized protein LOC111878953 [Lactuca sativa]|uniref:uncharacterized protein LOC111878953 n=1 Tax=Lactuca sativa TaxID=4236 RepID=UPI000CD8F43B|nr:uncharacterized protein LOC111878953 [Lactuca sativa]